MYLTKNRDPDNNVDWHHDIVPFINRLAGTDTDRLFHNNLVGVADC